MVVTAPAGGRLERATRIGAALRGALGFLSRLPVGRDDPAWAAFRATPAAFPAAGYVVGALLAIPLLLPAPAPTVALSFVVWAYLVTGITHLDGLADLGDALVVHGDAPARRAVMKDTRVGVGGVLAVTASVLGLSLAGLALASLPARAAALVIAAEVGAKLGMAAVACLGSAPHEGMGAQLTSRNRPRGLVLPVAIAAPAAAITWPDPAGAAALVAALVGTGAVAAWARARLGGASGDVFGAGNEVARVVALHAGAVVWASPWWGSWTLPAW